MTLNFPDSPSTGDIYDDSTSGFRYEWNGTVWISTDPARAANIKELDDISSGFNGSTTQFNLRVSSSAVEPVSDAQLLISVGGVMQNPTNDYTVSGSTITFTTAPSAGLTFFGVFLGQALSLNTVQDGTVSNTSFKAGTAGVGIQSAGSQIGVGITNLNFIGTGNTFVAIGNTVNVSVNVGGIDTTGTSYFNNITASGNLNVTGDLVYDEERVVNSIVSGTSTITNSNATQLLVSAGSTFNGDVDLGNATSDTITATGRFDSDIVPSTDNARDLGASGLEFKDLYIDGTANIDSLAADTAAIGDLTSGRVTYAGSSGELQDNAGLTFDGTTLAATRLAAPVAFTTSLTAANFDVTGITTIRDDLTLKGAAANITFDKSTDDLIFDDNAKAIFGTSSDGLEIYHNGSNSFIDETGTGNLYISAATDVYIRSNSTNKIMFRGTAGGSASLRYDNATKIETTSVGVNVTGNVDCDSINNAGISTFGGDVTFTGDAANVTWDKSTDDLIFADNAKAVFGTGGDLNIYHDASHSYLQDNGTGNLYLRTNGAGVVIDDGSNTFARFLNGNACDFNFNGTKRLETTSVGINVVGNVDCDSLNNAGISTFTGDATFSGGAGAVTLAAASDIRFPIGDWSGNSGTTPKIQGHSNNLYICGGSDGIIFREDATNRWKIEGSGNFEPASDSSYDIGSNSTRVRNLYADTLYGDGSNLTGVGGSVAPLEYNPDVGDTNVLVGSGIGLTFNQAVKAGSGNVTISVATNAGAAGTVFENFAIGSSATFGTSSFTIQPTNSLTTNETFRVDIPASAITNMSGDAMPATTWTFQAQAPVDKLMVWGNSTVGEFGLGEQSQAASSPVQIPGTTWAHIGQNAQSVEHAVARKSDGTLWSWGNNNVGQLGLSNQTQYSSPRQIGSLTNWSRIARSYLFTMATKTDNTFWTWGRGDGGGLGQNSQVSVNSPVQVPGTNWSTADHKLMPGFYSAGAIKTDGTLWTWGSNGSEGILGHSNTTDYSSPRQVGSGTDWDKTGSMGRQFAHATKTNGTLYLWGSNTYGQLGVNNKTQRNSPQQLPGTTWRQGTAADNWVIYTKTDNTLWAWGRNQYGQLGENQPVNTHRSSPVQIPGTTWSTVRTGSFGHWYAIKTDGTIWGCGRNTNGELGQNSTAGNRSSPVQIGSITPETGYNEVGGFSQMGWAQQTDTSP